MTDILVHHILSLLIFIPAVGALMLLVLPKSKTTLLKSATLFTMAIELVLALVLYQRFGSDSINTYQFSTSLPWIQEWNIQYYIGVDWLSALLIILTAFTMPLALWGTWNSVKDNLKTYLVFVLLLQTGIVGAFCALDLFLFYLFWEIMLVPMYFLIGIWGGKERAYASVKFFIYTMAGSVLMLIAILYLYFKAGQSFNLLELYYLKLTFSEQLTLFAAFALAFAIKVPLFPFHTWLPDAHVQAPTAGSVILAGVLLKMGTYGFFRFAIPLFPHAVVFLQPYLMLVAAFGVVYGALVAMIQPDMKKLVAFSSVSHMGVVMLGVFSLNPTALTGGLYQMINHAVSTGGLFLLIGMVYDRTHTRLIADYSGLAKKMPLFTVFFLIVTFSSIGVPLTNGFVGEFLTLMGSYQVDLQSSILGVVLGRKTAIMAATGVVLGAVYMLWLVQRVFFGPEKQIPGEVSDLNWRESALMIALTLVIFVMGIYPQPILSKLEISSQTLLLKLENDLTVGEELARK